MPNFEDAEDEEGLWERAPDEPGSLLDANSRTQRKPYTHAELAVAVLHSDGYEALRHFTDSYPGMTGRRHIAIVSLFFAKRKPYLAGQMPEPELLPALCTFIEVEWRSSWTLTVEGRHRIASHAPNVQHWQVPK